LLSPRSARRSRGFRRLKTTLTLGTRPQRTQPLRSSREATGQTSQYNRSRTGNIPLGTPRMAQQPRTLQVQIRHRFLWGGARAAFPYAAAGAFTGGEDLPLSRRQRLGQGPSSKVSVRWRHTIQSSQPR
jgi:hypothetical protein